MNRLELSQAVRTHRAKRGISLSVASAESEVSKSTLSRVESKAKPVNSETLARLASWMEMTVSTGGLVCNGNTLPNIVSVIEGDDKLSSEAKGKLVQIMTVLLPIYQDQ